MFDNDYVILIDENGQPYIAHSVFTKARDAAKSAARSAHKYIARIGNRYFYTQEELKAFYNRGKAAAGKAAEAVRGAARKTIGYDAKARYKAAKMRFNDAVDERRRTDDHSGNYKLFNSEDGEHARKAHNDHAQRAGDALVKARSEYDRTLLGTAERLKKRYDDTIASVKIHNAKKKVSDLEKSVSRFTDTYRHPGTGYFTFDSASGQTRPMADMYDGVKRQIDDRLQAAREKAARGESLSKAESAEIERLMDELKKYSIRKR